MEIEKDNTASESMNDLESVSIGYRMKQILLKLWTTIIRTNGEEYI
jgi:hypothetical protein